MALNDLRSALTWTLFSSRPYKFTLWERKNRLGEKLLCWTKPIRVSCISSTFSLDFPILNSMNWTTNRNNAFNIITWIAKSCRILSFSTRSFLSRISPRIVPCHSKKIKMPVTVIINPNYCMFKSNIFIKTLNIPGSLIGLLGFMYIR